MKRLILSVVMVTNIWAVEGDIDVGGTVLPAAIVGFDIPVTETLVDDTFTFKGSEIDIGVIPLGGKIAPITKNIYVKSNAKDGVTMEIIDNVNPHPFLAGHLIDSSGTNLVAMKYSLMGSAYAIKDHPARDLITTHADGSINIGTFVVEQKNNTSSDQPNGTYSAVFDVVIAAR